MDDFTLAMALVVWGLAPGWALQSAIGLRWSAVERAAASAGLSLVLVAIAAYLTTALGLPVSPVPVMAIVAVLCVAAAVAGRRRPPSAAADAAPEDSDDRPPWVAWLIVILPFIVATALEPISAVTLLPPSLHDGLDHANWFRLIYELGTVDPRVVLAPPLAPDGGASYYPWGLHAWLALVAHSTTADPTTVLMQGLVAVSAAVPLSVYVLAAFVIGRGWPATSAAAFSLFFWWLPYQVWGWGGYPLLAGAVAAPAVARLAITAYESRRAVPILAAGLCGLGLATIHPSQAFVALIMAATLSAALAPAGVVSARTAVAMAGSLAIGCVALVAAAEWWEPVRAFLARAESVGAVLSGDPRYSWPAGIYREVDLPFPFGRHVVVGALVAAGAVVAILTPRARALVALHAVFVLLIVVAPYGTPLTALWYHAPERIWYAQFVVYPAMAALGVSGVLTVVEAAWRRARARGLELRRSGEQERTPWRARLVFWPAAVWIVFAVAHGPWSVWASNRLFLYAQRNENLTVTDARVRADFEWMRAHIPAGEMIFNAPADWGLPLAFTGLRTVFWSGGVSRDLGLDWGAILRGLRQGGPAAASAASDLHDLGIRHVYAAVLNPRLQRRGRLPLDGPALDGVPGLALVYASPTARIFQVTGDGTELLGLADSDRLRFSGFHPIEEFDGTRWRWTDGEGYLYVQTNGLTGRSCHLRVFGPEPGTFEVRIDGRTIEPGMSGYALAVSGGAIPAEIEVAIVSPVVVPAEAGTGDDTRRLGVRVRAVGVNCA